MHANEMIFKYVLVTAKSQSRVFITNIDQKQYKSIINKSSKAV